MKSIYITTIITALFTVSACAEEQHAASNTKGNNGESYAAPIQHLVSDGVEIIAQFNAPSDLEGYVGRYQGRPLEIYLTSDGQHAVVGTLINGEGEPVSQPHLAQADSAGLDWESFGNTYWIAEGDQNAERIVYAFMDPNCPYCAVFWEKAQPFLANGGVQLRHIMVGILRPSSLPKGATMLAADDPAATLAQHQRTMQTGGISEMRNIPEDKLEQVKENTRFMRSIGLGGTPAFVFRDANGRVQQVQGVPSEHVMQELIFKPSK